MILVVTGVSGAGKTTVGRALAERLGWTFLDADDFHPPENVRRMRRGEPLSDADREAWLDALAGAIADAEGDAVATCSCLARRHRRRLDVPGRNVRFVHLEVGPEEAERRVSERADHFFGPGLVESQFETLEPPERGVTVDADRTPEAIVAAILRETGLDPEADPPPE